MGYVKCIGEGCQLCALFSPPTVHEVNKMAWTREEQLDFARETGRCPNCDASLLREREGESCPNCDFNYTTNEFHKLQSEIINKILGL